MTKAWFFLLMHTIYYMCETMSGITDGACVLDLKKEPDLRTVAFNDGAHSFVNNKTITARYNVFTFIPYFLFDQFRNYSNIFFLIIVILQQIPGVSPMGKYSTLMPLAVILFVSAIKEIYEDVLRHKEDRKTNTQTTEVLLMDGQWQSIQWQFVKVGNILRVKNHQELPADLLMLCTSDPYGLAYVETANLDGEDNLKIRRIPQQFSDWKIGLKLNELRGVLICDKPNEDIYSFDGIVKLQERDPVGVNEDQMLLRGATLRNVEWICGLVVYAGSDTKIRQNSKHKDAKRSSVNIVVNFHMLVLFSVFFVLTFTNCLLYVIWNYQKQDQMWYLPLGITKGVTASTFFTFAISYSFLIPISLQIYVEVARICQASFINKDFNMYYKERGMFAKCRNSNLNSDLGQVKYIFADKTGTLTKNQLEWKSCSIDGEVHTQGPNELTKLSKSSYAAGHLFLTICLCPGVLPFLEGGRIRYYSSTTDQLALIAAAKQVGLELRRRSYKDIEVGVHGEIQKFEVLCDVEFSSERKRTTVIVRDVSMNIILYTMGADDVIFSRASDTNRYKEQLMQHTNQFASSGLRTICFAMRHLKQSEFDPWYQEFQVAKLAVSSRKSLMAGLMDTMEDNLTLLGVVACEDKLQEEVPQTIRSFLTAGIKVWMLTGDKLETAINIGYSTKLISNYSNICILNTNDIQKLRRLSFQFCRRLSLHRNPVMVCTGGALQAMLATGFGDYFINTAMKCDAVVCCRLIPRQKAVLVDMVQKSTNYVTLAVGDGANDVAMIQTATIGVGISGFEGLQAVYAADYSIAVFKHLKRLLFVHGTLNYNRISKLIYYIYYKNVPISVSLLYFSYATGWSAASLFDDWSLSFFNVLLTDGATLAIGILDREYSEDMLFENPSMYHANSWFNTKTFYACLLNSIYHTVLLLYLMFGVMDNDALWPKYNGNYIVQGMFVYTVVLVIVVLKALLHMKRMNKRSYLFVIGTALLWIPILFIYGHFNGRISLNEDTVGIDLMMLRSPMIIFALIQVPLTVLLLDIVVVALYRTLKYHNYI